MAMKFALARGQVLAMGHHVRALRTLVFARRDPPHKTRNEPLQDGPFRPQMAMRSTSEQKQRRHTMWHQKGTQRCRF
jgi:hypothetical protein